MPIMKLAVKKYHDPQNPISHLSYVYDRSTTYLVPRQMYLSLTWKIRRVVRMTGSLSPYYVQISSKISISQIASTIDHFTHLA